MSRTGWTPSIVPMVPYGADQTVYLVVDSYGRLGTAYRETDIKRSDLESVITDLMSGQFNDPVRVVAFNTLEHWAQDVSRDVALEIQSRGDINGHDVSEVGDLAAPSLAISDMQLARAISELYPPNEASIATLCLGQWRPPIRSPITVPRGMPRHACDPGHSCRRSFN